MSDMASPPTPDMAMEQPDLSLPDRDPLDHPKLPQMRFGGGRVLSSAEAWTVVWQGDEALGGRIYDFLNWMLNSEYYTGTLGQYGVHAGKSMGVLVIPSAPPAKVDDSQIEGILNSLVAAHPEVQLNTQTVFVMIFNSKTKSSMGGGGNGCQDYGGYHYEAYVGGVEVAYEVNLQCSGFGGSTPFDSLTDVVSHEMAEAATDPLPQSAPGWNDNNWFETPFGGEVGDLCLDLDQTYDVEVTDVDAGTNTPVSYFVTRLWSNAAAKAGDKDPCQPVASTRPYFNVAVSPLTVDVSADPNGPTVFDAEYQPYAAGDVGKIKWETQGVGAGITFDPAYGEGYAGETIPLKITIDADAQSGIYPIYIFTESAKGGTNQFIGSLVVH